MASKEVQTEMIGLSKLDVVTVFKRYFGDRAVNDSLINSVAMAVGEVVEENNRRLLEEYEAKNSKKRGSVL